MAKYLPTVNLWDAATYVALKNGQLKLQSGQWVQCGEGQKSRFIRYNKKSDTIVCAHGGSNKQVTARYMAAVNVQRETVRRFGKM